MRTRRPYQSHPEGLTLLSHAFGQALDLVVVGPERESEHVRDELVREALVLQLGNQVDEHLIRGVCQLRPGTRGRCQLRDQHGRLTHDGVDQNVDVHARKARCQPLAPIV